jgi:hypothetical protein
MEHKAGCGRIERSASRMRFGFEREREREKERDSEKRQMHLHRENCMDVEGPACQGRKVAAAMARLHTRKSFRVYQRSYRGETNCFVPLYRVWSETWRSEHQRRKYLGT